MPRNPLAHPLFWPVAWRVALMLLVGLGGVVLAERRRLGQLGGSTLFLRVRTWAWIAPVFVLAVFTGGVVVFLLAAVIALQGVAEYAHLIELERRYLAPLAAWSIVGLLVAALARRYFLFLPLGFFLLISLTPIVSGQTRGAHRQVNGAIFGDLIESFVKRDFAVKDAGAVLAGFGGVLDRVDSLLIALPLGYYALIVADNLAGR